MQNVMMNKHFSRAEINQLPQRFRANFINSLSGYKSANLVATISADGQENLAIISSVVHLGANPPLLGMVMRPHTVRRDTIENIVQTGIYTINHVAATHTKQAHQTSARYDDNQSEFVATGLESEYLDEFACPYVKQSAIKMAMRFVEMLPIRHNNTSFIIGEIEHVYVPDSLIKEDGLIDLDGAQTVCISGLDSYHLPKKHARYGYAKADTELETLEQ